MDTCRYRQTSTPFSRVCFSLKERVVVRKSQWIFLVYLYTKVLLKKVCVVGILLLLLPLLLLGDQKQMAVA